MPERRQFVRVDSRCQVTYTTLAGIRQGGVTKNISVGGVCFSTAELLTPGTRLQVAMTLPPREQPVRFVGEVAWSEQYQVADGTPGQLPVDVGIRFIEIAQADRDAVTQYVAQHNSHRSP